jgi:hypothetical protein
MFDAFLTGAAGTKVFHLDVDPLKQQMPRTFTIRPYDCLFPVSLIIRYQYSRSTPLADSRLAVELRLRKSMLSWMNTISLGLGTPWSLKNGQSTTRPGGKLYEHLNHHRKMA